MSSDHQSKRSKKRFVKKNDHGPRRKPSRKLSTKKDNGPSLLVYISILVALGAVFFSFYSNSSNHFDDKLVPSPSTNSSSSSSESSRRKITRRVSLDKDDILIDKTQKWNTSDPILVQTYDFLSNYVCNDPDDDRKTSKNTAINTSSSYCHPLIQPAPQRRTHYVAKTKSNKISMRQGDIVMVLPRTLLIWDLDAMRNREFIQKELFHARHEITGNSLDSGAFLASFLIYRQKTIQGTWTWKENQNVLDESTIAMSGNQDTRLIEYLNILPQYNTLRTTHPTLWSEGTIKNLFGKSTMTSHLVKAYKDMIKSEYKAFCEVSAVFKSNINEKEYTAMRINVMSRSFGPGTSSFLHPCLSFFLLLFELSSSFCSSISGPPGPNEELSTDSLSLKEELELYQKLAGVNLTKGCRAMSPILDMWDHHAKPNVKWIYSREEKAFVITVFDREIPPLNDIMVSYGMYTDSHLFAKFGFVNGDGSGHTEISIAAMHQLLDLGLGQQYSYMKYRNDGQTQTPLPSDGDNQKKSLLQYLVSDDGYEECIEKEKNPRGYELKLLKYRLLQAIANKRERWTVKFQPRNEESKPATNSFTPIQTHPPRFDPQNVKFDGSKIIPTCRLLALTNEDYEGRALEVLKDVFESGKADTFQVNRQTDELEYRALMWLARLTNMVLKKYPTTVREDMESLASPEVSFRSKEWNALQVRLGEMQTLESLRSIASSGTRHMMERVKRRKKNADTPQMYIRQKVCRFEYTAKLLEKDNY